MRRLAANGLVQRVPHPTDGRTTLVQITGFGRSTVEDATVTLPAQIARCVGHRRGQLRAGQHGPGIERAYAAMSSTATGTRIGIAASLAVSAAGVAFVLQHIVRLLCISERG
jgi:hypothetical protein